MPFQDFVPDTPKRVFNGEGDGFTDFVPDTFVQPTAVQEEEKPKRKEEEYLDDESFIAPDGRVYKMKVEQKREVIKKK